MKSEFIIMPESIKLYNNCDTPCDLMAGPCVCGHWHNRKQIIELCKQQGILTTEVKKAIREAKNEIPETQFDKVKE